MPECSESRAGSDDIARSEISDAFHSGMRNRMLISFHKYGPVADAYPHKVDAIASLMQRLRIYANGDQAKGIPAGNTEYLIDAANFAMIEFMHPRHPEAHFKGTDDDGSPGRISSDTGRADKRDNVEIGTNPGSITARFR
jgi:hypothetical protein